MKALYSFIFIVAASISNGQPFTATYDFADVTTSSGAIDPTPVPTVPGLTMGNFVAINTVNGTTNSAAAGRFAFTRQPLGATDGETNYANLTGNIHSGIYYEVTLTPLAGYALNVTQITFTTQRSTTGIRTYVVRSNADAYTTNLPASISPPNNQLSVESDNVFFRVNDSNTSALDGSTITLEGASFSGLENPITFRFYGYNAESNTGNFSIDNVAISGTVATLNTKDEAISGLKTYPNPLKGDLLYITSDSTSEKTVQIFDLLGNEKRRLHTVDTTLNLTGLASGIYIVKVTQEGQTATRKLVVQ